MPNGTVIIMNIMMTHTIDQEYKAELKALVNLRVFSHKILIQEHMIMSKRKVLWVRIFLIARIRC